MKVERFEDIIAWQKARILTLMLYKIMRGSDDHNFKNQILRASVSIMNNIAEGYERQGDKEFRHFLFIAKGSCGECRSMLNIGKELGYIKVDEYSIMYNLSVEVSKILSGFIKTL